MACQQTRPDLLWPHVIWCSKVENKMFSIPPCPPLPAGLCWLPWGFPPGRAAPESHTKGWRLQSFQDARQNVPQHLGCWVRPTIWRPTGKHLQAGMNNSRISWNHLPNGWDATFSTQQDGITENQPFKAKNLGTSGSYQCLPCVDPTMPHPRCSHPQHPNQWSDRSADLWTERGSRAPQVVQTGKRTWCN